MGRGTAEMGKGKRALAGLTLGAGRRGVENSGVLPGLLIFMLETPTPW
jgi:hypothetical protein